MTSKMRATSKPRMMSKNEDNPKNEEDLKGEGKLKNECNLKMKRSEGEFLSDVSSTSKSCNWQLINATCKFSGPGWLGTIVNIRLSQPIYMVLWLG